MWNRTNQFYVNETSHRLVISMTYYYYICLFPWPLSYKWSENRKTSYELNVVFMAGSVSWNYLQPVKRLTQSVGLFNSIIIRVHVAYGSVIFALESRTKKALSTMWLSKTSSHFDASRPDYPVLPEELQMRWTSNALAVLVTGAFELLKHKSHKLHSVFKGMGAAYCIFFRSGMKLCSLVPARPRHKVMKNTSTKI